MFELYTTTKDSINSIENQKAVILQEYQYQYEKKAATDSIMAIEENDNTVVWDFGFTAVSETELDAYQEAQSEIQKVSGEAGELQARLDRLFSSIQPLLNNLKKDPSKDYILWPNRLEKIEAFEDMLQGIYMGK